MAIRIYGQDDEVFVIGSPKHIKNLLKSIKQTDKPAKRIIIASGGNIGRRLAKLLEDKYQVKVIELSVEKAQQSLGRTEQRPRP